MEYPESIFSTTEKVSRLIIRLFIDLHPISMHPPQEKKERCTGERKRSFHEMSPTYIGSHLTNEVTFL